MASRRNAPVTMVRLVALGASDERFELIGGTRTGIGSLPELMGGASAWTAAHRGLDHILTSI